MALVANGGGKNDPSPMAAFAADNKKKHASSSGGPQKSYASALVASAPAGVSEQQQQQQQPDSATPPTTAPLFGSERIADIIRREQHNQMQQQLSKGSTTGQAHKKSAPVPIGSADAAKIYCKEDGLFIDEQELLSCSTFPIPPERLVEMARDVLRAGVHQCGRLAKDFQFSAPFVGPLPPQGFAKTMQTLSLDDVFPDMSPRIYHVRVDPLQPNRVWFTTRPIGTNSGYLTANLPIPVAPSYKVVELPPQTSSLSFNEQGQVIDFTMGYVMDRRIGNSGGLGGAFGFLWALGVPFPYPEGKPWSASWQQRLFNTGNPLLQVAMFVLDRVSNAVLPSFLTSAHSRAMP